MKKIVLVCLISMILLGNDKEDIVNICIEDGNSKSICECAYEKTSNEVDLSNVIKMDLIIDTLDTDSIEYKTAIEILNDYNTIFEMKLDECRSEKLQTVFK